MARFALIKPDGTTIDRMASDVDPTVATKPGFRWLPCLPVAQPSFDPLSEIVAGPAYTVNANDVTEVWTKRALTVPEISDRKDAAIASVNGGFSPILKVLFNLNNRVRVLEGQAAITLPQFKAAIKALL